MSILLQIIHDTVNAAAQPTYAATPTPEKLSFLELLMKGGWVMIPIGILSILAVYFIIERYLTIRKAAKINQSFMSNIRDYLMNGRMDAATMLCKNTNTPIARLLEKGLKRIGKPIKEVESAVESEGRLEIYQLEKNMNFIGIISGIAPMFGFLGTIFGVIKIFYEISLANNISIGLIAGGLYEKMITSAAGLIVGIFAHVGFHYLNSMIDRVSYQLESTAVEFIDLIQEPTS